ncbi:hypothetical protein JOM56_003339 [Amanita muscaria]
MSVSLDIIPFAESVCMYGMPDASSAYSLSGHVAITLRSSHSFFERRSATRLLLQSLELTFEGQNEIVTQKIGYSAIRLCSFSRELVTDGPIELSNEDEEDSAEPCVWNVVFNLAIPGWLPDTTRIDYSDLGVRYALHATAKFAVLDDQPSNSSWFLAMLCTPFRSRVRYARAQKQVIVRRFVKPPSDAPFRLRSNAFGVSTPTPQSSKASTPSEVLEKIQAIVAVPEFANMDADGIPITLRMRTNGLEAAECQRLQVKEITADIVQKEKYRSRPSAAYMNTFPVPPKERQPPNEPLLSPHPVNSLYEYGLAIPLAERPESMTRITSFLPPGESGRHCFGKKNYAFGDDTVAKGNPNWYTIEITLPFATEKTASAGQKMWCDKIELQSSVSSPLLHITHEVALSVTLSYDLDDKENRSYDRLSIRVPINLVRALPVVTALPYSDSSVPTLPMSTMPSYILPAYSQLYDEEGERKIDYSTPLPLYQPPSTPEELDANSDKVVTSIS